MHHRAFALFRSRSQRIHVRITCTAILAAWLMAGQAASGDVVVLTSGDVLRGEVMGRGDESLTLEHPVLGTLTIPVQKVESFSISDTEPTETESAGDASAAPPAEASSQAESLEAKPDTGAATSPDAQANAPEVDEPDKAGLFGTSFLQGWTRQAELGVIGETGVTDSLDVTAKVSADFEDDRKRWTLDARYLHGQEEGELTDSEFDANVQRDWLFPEEPVFYFAEGGYEFDNFQVWEHRVRGGGGVGYTFLDNDTFELDGRVGGSALYEFGGEADDELIPEGIVGVQFAWNIRDGQVFTAFNDFFPQLEDAGEFRNITGLEYTIDLDTDEPFSLKLGVENEHDSTNDISKNDLMYYTTLVAGF